MKIQYSAHPKINRTLSFASCSNYISQHTSLCCIFVHTHSCTLSNKEMISNGYIHIQLWVVQQSLYCKDLYANTVTAVTANYGMT